MKKMFIAGLMTAGLMTAGFAAQGQDGMPTFGSFSWSDIDSDGECPITELTLDYESRNQWATIPVSGQITTDCVQIPEIPDTFGVVGSGWVESAEVVETEKPAPKLSKGQRKACKKGKLDKHFCNGDPIVTKTYKNNYIFDIMYGENTWRIYLDADGTAEITGTNSGQLD